MPRKLWVETSPAGDWLIALYYSMLNTTRWQRQHGADFVFYDPHPGFVDGSAEEHYYNILCDTAQHSMHIVAERGQRNICQVTARRTCSVSPRQSLYALSVSKPASGRGLRVRRVPRLEESCPESWP